MHSKFQTINLLLKFCGTPVLDLRAILTCSSRPGPHKWLAWSLSVQVKFYWNTATPISLHLPKSANVLQEQSWEQTTWPAKPKILSGPLQKAFTSLCLDACHMPICLANLSPSWNCPIWSPWSNGLLRTGVTTTKCRKTSINFKQN